MTDPYASIFQKQAETPAAPTAPAGPDPYASIFTPGAASTNAETPPATEDKYAASEVPRKMVENFLPDAGRILGDAYEGAKAGVDKLIHEPASVGHALVHDVLPDLPGHLIDFGAKVLDSTLGKYFDADNFKKDFAEKGGVNALNYFDWDKTKTTMADKPAEFMMDLSTVAPVLQAGKLSKLGAIAGPESKVIQAMDPSKALTTLRDVAASGGNSAAHVADHMVQAADGIGEGAVAQMLNSGKAANKDAWKTMTGGLDWDKSADIVRNSVTKLVEKRGDDYITNMAQVAGAHTPVDFARVDKAVNDAMGVQRYKSPTDLTPGKGVRYGDVAGGEVDKMRNAVRNAVNEWKAHGPDYHTAIGFDKLKQTIQSLSDTAKGGNVLATPSSTIASKVANAIRQTIMQTPEAADYAKAMKTYGDQSQQLTNIIKEFSLNSTNNMSTFRKLQKVWRQSADVAHGERTNLLRTALEDTGNGKLMDDLAAAQFHPWTPRGVRGAAVGTMLMHGLFHNPVTALGTAAAMSPRLAGAAAYGLGRAQSIPFLSKGVGKAYTGAEAALPVGIRAQTYAGQNDEPAEKRGGYFRGKK